MVVQAAGTDESAVLDALEAGLIAGLLSEPAPGRVRFVHALVRDTMYTDLPGYDAPGYTPAWPTRSGCAPMTSRRSPTTTTGRRRPTPPPRPWGTRCGPPSSPSGATPTTRPSSCSARPWSANSGSPPARPTRRRPGRRAGRPARPAAPRPGTGRRRRGGPGHPGAGRRPRRSAGREDLLVEAFTAWTEPTPWVARPYGTVDERVVAPLRLLRRDDLDPATRCRLLAALVTELAGEGDPRAAQAATEAVGLARASAIRPCSPSPCPSRRGRRAGTGNRIGARAWHADRPDRRRAQPRRLPLARRVHRRHRGRGRNDPATLRHHIQRGLELAQTYEMAEPQAVGRSSQAMLAHIAGRFDDAERLYAEACAHLARHGSPHADGFGVLARSPSGRASNAWPSSRRQRRHCTRSTARRSTRAPPPSPPGPP